MQSLRSSQLPLSHAWDGRGGQLNLPSLCSHSLFSEANPIVSLWGLKEIAVPKNANYNLYDPPCPLVLFFPIQIYLIQLGKLPTEVLMGTSISTPLDCLHSTSNLRKIRFQPAENSSSEDPCPANLEQSSIVSGFQFLDSKTKSLDNLSRRSLP